MIHFDRYRAWKRAPANIMIIKPVSITRFRQNARRTADFHGRWGGGEGRRRGERWFHGRCNNVSPADAAITAWRELHLQSVTADDGNYGVKLYDTEYTMCQSRNRTTWPDSAAIHRRCNDPFIRSAVMPLTRELLRPWTTATNIGERSLIVLVFF
jgi:hypothetical protein